MAEWMRARSFRLSPHASPSLSGQGTPPHLLESLDAEPPLTHLLPSPSGGQPRPPCIPSLTSQLSAEKPSETSPQNWLYATGYFIASSFVLILISRAHPPPSSVPRSIFMYRRTSFVLPRLSGSDSSRPGRPPCRRTSDGYGHLHVRH